jgi:mannose-6-phosphate isomerase class I
VGPDGLARELHLEQALRSIDCAAGPASPLVPKPLADMPAGVGGEQLVRCAYFELARFRPSAPFPLPYAGRLSLWMVLDGALQLSSSASGYSRTLRRGEAVLVPAAAPPLTWLPLADGPPATLLGVRVP